MTAILNLLTKFLPALLPLIDKFMGRKDTAQKGDTEIEELRTFTAGKLTPRYLLKYVIILLFALFGILTILSIFFPAAVSAPDLAKMQDAIAIGLGLAD